jgi:hypothetical protein
VVLHQRTGFAASMIDGRTVMEIPGDERSAEEIRQLWTYIGVRLGHAVPAPSETPLLAAPAEDEGEACAA